MTVRVRTRARLPGTVNMVGAAAMLLVVLTLALRASQSGPPAIAEFAPQAQQIKQAPSEQTGSTGSASGASGGLPSPSPSPPPPAGVPAGATLLRCVGDPPRQIEDPQSPPCVPYWQGDNGGATSKGVTRETVRIYVPWTNQDGTGDEQLVVNDFERFFNQRFEFYGRQLDLRLDTTRGSSASPSGQQAAAVYADQQVGAFASTSYQSTGGSSYYPALAQHHIIGAAAEGEFAYGASRLAELSPYLWQYEISADQDFASMASWVCSRLAGSDAVHAGDATLHSKARIFGVIYDPAPSGETADFQSIAPLVSGLQTCGAGPAYVYDGGPVGEGGNTQGYQAMENILAGMRTHGVTSIICECTGLPFVQFENDAQGQGYLPEWLVSSYGGLDELLFYKFGASLWEGAATFPGTFGITFRPRQVPIADEPFYWALTAEGLNDSQNQSNLYVWFRQWLYRSLLMLASGIQMAGPDLSPATFAGGLDHTDFPNPPYFTMPGKVGFLGGSHSMTIDGAEWWWSDSAKTPYPGDSAGSFCYVDGGARHAPDAWPKGGDPFFQGPCDSGA